MTQRQRARRDTRLAQPKPIRLTERDLQIIQAVYDYRVLTTQQLKTLFFPSLHQAYDRLAALYHHGFLDRQFIGVHADKMNTPILYLLDRRGAELLQAERGLDVVWSREHKQVGLQFLEHTIAINTVRVAVAKACDQLGFPLKLWRSENELKADYDYAQIRTPSGRMKSVSVIPDSYFWIETSDKPVHCFLELDRGTMTTQRFKAKILAYLVYYQSGAYERRYQTERLRVLTVTTSKARAASLQRVTEEAGGKQRFWFTTLEQVKPETILIQPIWNLATQEERRALI